LLHEEELQEVKYFVVARDMKLNILSILASLFDGSDVSYLGYLAGEQ
jgi:hypothetical protein